MSINKYFEETAVRATILSNDIILNNQVEDAIDVICNAFANQKPLLVCGNGGSASDAAHITGELVGRFLKERKGLNAICLSTNAAVITAWANDYNYDDIFARQTEAHGIEGGILWGISTSGNSSNVLKAFDTAKKMNMITIGMTGKNGGKLAESSDILINVPFNHTPHIQEAHICIYHYMCQIIEERML